MQSLHYKFLACFDPDCQIVVNNFFCILIQVFYFASTDLNRRWECSLQQKTRILGAISLSIGMIGRKKKTSAIFLTYWTGYWWILVPTQLRLWIGISKAQYWRISGKSLYLLFTKSYLLVRRKQLFKAWHFQWKNLMWKLLAIMYKLPFWKHFWSCFYYDGRKQLLMYWHFVCVYILFFNSFRQKTNSNVNF